MQGIYVHTWIPHWNKKNKLKKLYRVQYAEFHSFPPMICWKRTAKAWPGFPKLFKLVLIQLRNKWPSKLSLIHQLQWWFWKLSVLPCGNENKCRWYKYLAEVKTLNAEIVLIKLKDIQVWYIYQEIRGPMLSNLNLSLSSIFRMIW